MDDIDGLMPCPDCGSFDLAHSTKNMPVNCRKCGAWARSVEAWNLADMGPNPFPPKDTGK